MILSNNDKTEILKFLDGRKLMVVSTYNRLPWSASVYFLYDDSLNLYFVSNPKTKHCQNIAKNPKVSVVIVNTEQDPNGNKVGLQARGTAKKVTSVGEIKEIIKSWNKRGFVPVTYSVFKKAWKSRFYKIKLTDLQIFDESLGEKKEVRCWKI